LKIINSQVEPTLILNSWNGQSILAPVEGYFGRQGKVIKMDTKGNTIWIKNYNNELENSPLNKSVIYVTN
jgi:hypothetical protein